MKNKIINYITGITFILITMLSCIKNEVTPLKDEGDPLLKIAEGATNKIFFAPFTDVKKTSLLTVQRDVANNQQLSTAKNFKLITNPTLITDYNTANSTDYEILPDSLYNIVQGVSRSGNEWTVPFASGDFAKSVDINLSGAKWNLSKKYALAFTITDSAGIKISGAKTILVFLAIKNKYDGKYDATGYFYHPASPRDIAMSHTLATAGPNSVMLDVETLGPSGYKAIITVDQSTNNLTIAAAPGATGSPYTMFTTGLPSTSPGYTGAWPGSSTCNNTYDPSTKTFYIRYGYLGGTGWRIVEEVLKMK